VFPAPIPPLALQKFRRVGTLQARLPRPLVHNGSVKVGQLHPSCRILPLHSPQQAGTNVSGPGLRHLKTLPRLALLDLDGSSVTDKDLQSLRHFPALEVLCLSGTDISDAGLEHVATISTLERLFLDRTNVKGSGLAHLKGLPRLTHLGLSGTPLDDE